MNDAPKSALKKTWEYYVAMNQSKDKHLEALMDIDKKRKAGNNVTLAEESRLSSLLEVHSRQVKMFAEKMAYLREFHPTQQKSLLKKIEKFINKVE